MMLTSSLMSLAHRPRHHTTLSASDSSETLDAWHFRNNDEMSASHSTSKEALFAPNRWLTDSETKLDHWHLRNNDESRLDDTTQREAAAAIAEGAPPIRAACADELPSHERLLLTLYTPAYHGSTAAMQALMSSPKVATMCNGRQWQCENGVGKARCRQCLKFEQRNPEALVGVEPPVWSPRNGSTLEAAAGTRLPCLGCINTSRAESNRVAYSRTLQAFAPFWRAQPGRRVLAVKWAPLHSSPVQGPKPPLSKWNDDTGLDMVHGWGSHGLTLPKLEAAVPRRLVADGVTRVRWAVLLVVRPWCMWQLSSNARFGRSHWGVQRWAQRELRELEALIALHRRLDQLGVPTVVVNYAHLLWRDSIPGANPAAQLGSFAPCAGEIALDFEPVEGVDVYPANLLKISGSLAAYGATTAGVADGVATEPQSHRCAVPGHLSSHAQPHSPAACCSSALRRGTPARGDRHPARHGPLRQRDVRRPRRRSAAARRAGGGLSGQPVRDARHAGKSLSTPLAF
tara:strand:+ start:376 stop:1917 length:1542 start_codon:yes stop_codon:yes gene_type:complete